ncbi:AraC-like DNA-binding protein [Streptosporangium album]|uniref:AraC-like DNA-binding protein n=1 Tax=Streptosporangium album TaxID=47479 RepID=A0A7W7WDW3_9ACTN|nr:AraC-like DNA-binding protein [Streptosporangium album]
MPADPPDGGAPIALNVGDVVFLPHGSGYALADSPTTPLTEPVCDPLNDSRFEDRYASATVGKTGQDGSQAVTVTLCGGYRLDPSRAHPLLGDPAIGAALHALHRDPAHPWTVETLGSQTGLSRAAFSRRFTALIGQPPLTYLTWWRMTTAARLLRESDASLGEVAARIGYTSEFAFANAFKREYGTAPGKYRRQSRAEPGAVN